MMDTFGAIMPGCSKHTSGDAEMRKTTKETL